MNRSQSDLDAALRLELVGHMLTDTHWGGYEHHHAFDELLYVQKGAVSYCTEHTAIPLQQGEMLLIPEGVFHKITASRPSSFLYVGFRTNLIDLSHVFSRVLRADQTSDLSILALRLDDMTQKAFEERIPFADFSARIMTFLIPALVSLSQDRNERDPKTILSDKVKQYIRSHSHQPIRVDEIAASLYHSPHYLGNCFAAVNGMTIKEYTLQFKMQKALWLLQNESGSVAQIAGLLGYDSAHYFSKCFKQYFGFSPSKMRQ